MVCTANKQSLIKAVYGRFGTRVAALRAKRRLTQQELADRVGLTRPSIANIEAGRQRILLADVAVFARALHTTPQTLLRGIWVTP